MEKKTLRIRILITLIFLLFLAACQRVNQDNLEDTSWVITEINGSTPIVGTILTIEFKDGQISGTAGCNHFGGNYDVDEEQISFDSLFNTEMACQDPEGVMNQEQVYLGILREAVRYSNTDSTLIIYDKYEAFLVYEPDDADKVEPIDGQKNDTVTVQAPTKTSNIEASSEPNASWEYHTYQDPQTGIMIKIPESWIVTGIVEGERAVLQSYPEDKYVGGEVREEGDTKCDLNIQPVGTSQETLIEQWESDPMTAILSEEPFGFAGGYEGTRYEVDSRGLLISFVVNLDGRVVVLSCFGNFDRVDEIAATLKRGD